MTTVRTLAAAVLAVQACARTALPEPLSNRTPATPAEQPAPTLFWRDACERAGRVPRCYVAVLPKRIFTSCVCEDR